jgi:hypothetical protein
MFLLLKKILIWLSLLIILSIAYYQYFSFKMSETLDIFFRRTFICRIENSILNCAWNIPSDWISKDNFIYFIRWKEIYIWYNYDEWKIPNELKIEIPLSDSSLDYKIYLIQKNWKIRRIKIWKHY